MSGEVIQAINNLAVTFYMCTGKYSSEENPITIELPYENYLRVNSSLIKNASYGLNDMRITEFTPEFKVNTPCGSITVRSRGYPVGPFGEQQEPVYAPITIQSAEENKLKDKND